MPSPFLLLTDKRWITRIAIFYFLWSLLHIFFSFVVGIGQLENDAHKNVGYASAINWSVVYTIMLPLIITLIGALAVEMKSAIKSMVQAEMIAIKRDDEPDAVVSKDAQAIWENFQERFKVFGAAWAVATALGVSWSVFEWYGGSITPHTEKFDWCQGWMLGKDISPFAVRIFTFSVFLTLQASIISAGFLYIFLICAFCAFMYDPSDPRKFQERGLLLPSLRSQDKRKGFECLESLGLISCAIGLLAYVCLYLSVTEKIYLSKPDFHDSAIIMLLKDYFISESYTKLQLFEPISVVDPGMILLLIAAAIILVIGCFVVPFVCFMYLAYTARSAAYRMGGHHSDPGKDAQAKPYAAAAKDMAIWPFKYILFNKALAFLAVFSLGIVCYKLIPAICLGFAVAAFYQFLKRARSMASNSD